MIFSPKRRAGKSIGSRHIDICETCKKAENEGECVLCALEEAKNHNHKH